MAEESGAEEITHLSIINSDGSLQQFALDNVGLLTFDDEQENLIIGETKIPIDNIKSMRFDLEVTAPGPEESAVEEVIDDVEFRMEGNVATLSSTAGEELNVNVYDMKGIRLFSATRKEPVSIDFSGYGKGVYIIKANNKVIKLQN